MYINRSTFKDPSSWAKVIVSRVRLRSTYVVVIIEEVSGRLIVIENGSGIRWKCSARSGGLASWRWWQRRDRRTDGEWDRQSWGRVVMLSRFSFLVQDNRTKIRKYLTKMTVRNCSVTRARRCSCNDALDPIPFSISYCFLRRFTSYSTYFNTTISSIPSYPADYLHLTVAWIPLLCVRKLKWTSGIPCVATLPLRSFHTDRLAPVFVSFFFFLSDFFFSYF